MRFLRILAMTLMTIASIFKSTNGFVIPTAMCECAVIPICAQQATHSLSRCAVECHTKPEIDQDGCLVECNLVFQSVMQETRVCPEKVCENCEGCIVECKSFLGMCKKVCPKESKECLDNCSEEYTKCSQDSVPCAIPAPVATPAPTFPEKRTRDLALINELMKESLSLTDGVYFSTEPDSLPHKGVTVIGKGEFLQSPSGLYVLQFLDNGDMGVFAGNVQLWQAPRVGSGEPGHISFDPENGVMRMYSSTDVEWWNSLSTIRNSRECYIRNPWRTWYCRMVPRPASNPLPTGKAPYRLVVTDNGNVEIVDSVGKVFFETATSDREMLISDITAIADYAKGVTTPENLIQFLQGWGNVPVEVRIMFETASYAGEDQWKIFSIHFAPSQGMVEEWVGATKMVNETISLLYIHVKSVGKPVQQYTPVHIHQCHRHFFHKSCSDSTTNVPRGFEADELLSMAISLRRAGFFALQNLISRL